MIKKTPIVVFLFILVFLLTFGISRYNINKRAEKKSTYVTSTGNIIMGGMASDKEKIESFKKSVEEDSKFRKYWDLLHLSSKYEKEENYNTAIETRREALSYARTKGDVFQVIWGLIRLYEKTGQYELAIKEIDKVKTVNDREDVLKKAEEIRKRLLELKSQ